LPIFESNFPTFPVSALRPSIIFPITSSIGYGGQASGDRRAVCVCAAAAVHRVVHRPVRRRRDALANAVLCRPFSSGRAYLHLVGTTRVTAGAEAVW